MLSRDNPLWHTIAVVCLAVTGSAAMITPENLGLSQITVNWVILMSSILGTISASMGNSGLPGNVQQAQMVVGKAVVSPTAETKAAAVTAIASLPEAPPSVP